MSETKTCRVCKTAKLLEEFYKDATGPQGRFSCCKPCWNVQARERRGSSRPPNKKHIINTGDQFGWLTALALSTKKTKTNGAMYVCRCVCGLTMDVDKRLLIAEQRSSCGCKRNFRHRTHGKVGTREYHSWVAMRSRCNNPKDIGYHRYGGRGIKVCDRWNRFENFLEDMGPRPENYSLDRIDNNGNYEPSNCQWASRVAQANNQRTNRFITFNGETLSVTQWQKKMGFGEKTIFGRLEDGWSVERAITTPISLDHVHTKGSSS